MLILFTSISFGLSEYHFRSHEKEFLNMPNLNLNLDNESIFKEEIKISNQIAAQLHFESAYSYQWQKETSSRFNPYTQKEASTLRKNTGKSSKQMGLRGACTAVLSTHSPESCLPLTGLTQINPPIGQNPILVPIKIENREVLFEAYEFSRSYRKLFVFRCFWPHKLAPGQPNLFPRGGYNFKGRVKAAIAGRRNVGGTMLALALANVDSAQTAITKLKELNQRLSFSE